MAALSLRKIEPSTMWNYSLIYTWNPEDLRFDIYAEGHLRNMHKSFGLLQVRTTVNLLKHAARGTIPRNMRVSIQKWPRRVKPAECLATRLSALS